MNYSRRIELIVIGMLIHSSVEGPSKPLPQKPSAFDGKKVVALAPIQRVEIEMPDQSIHNFGEDFQARLTTELLQTKRYIVADTPPRSRSSLESPNFFWQSSVAPSVIVNIRVDALSFQTGSRGEKAFYGFEENFRTSFNNGFETISNEFPLRPSSEEVSWFGHTFDRKGNIPFDSQSGLDLGDGFFFDVAGAYQNFSAGIRVARRDAMLQVLNQAIAASTNVMEHALSPLPLVARVDAVLPNGTVLLGTGPSSEVRTGIMRKQLFLNLKPSTDLSLNSVKEKYS